MSQHKYRFSPSAINKFYEYLNSDQEFEGKWNRGAGGDYKQSAQEIAEIKERELLDYINKVPQAQSEAADKGTVFNEIIDRLILHKKDGREDVSIRSGKMQVGYYDEVPVVFGEMDRFHFTYDLQLCLGLARELTGAVPQYHTEAILPTKYGNVLLHGYIDYVLDDKVIDLKTTSDYSYPKFNDGWQKDVYPYCLIESGMMKSVPEFDYIVVHWKDLVGRPTTGAVYVEPYTYNHEASTLRLRNICEWFIEWLEMNRERITNKAIFGE